MHRQALGFLPICPECLYHVLGFDGVEVFWVSLGLRCFGCRWGRGVLSVVGVEVFQVPQWLGRDSAGKHRRALGRDKDALEGQASPEAPSRFRV